VSQVWIQGAFSGMPEGSQTLKMGALMLNSELCGTLLHIVLSSYWYFETA